MIEIVLSVFFSVISIGDTETTIDDPIQVDTMVETSRTVDNGTIRREIQVQR